MLHFQSNKFSYFCGKYEENGKEEKDKEHLERVHKHHIEHLCSQPVQANELQADLQGDGYKGFCR